MQLTQKWCNKCRQYRPLSDFGVRKKAPDGRQSECRECRRKSNRDYYEKTRHRNDQRTRKVDRIRLIQDSVIFEALEHEKCVDCGEDDTRVLDFDHVNGEKLENISRMQYESADILLAEIAKCEVRCANCHRKVTAERSQNRRQRWYEAIEQGTKPEFGHRRVPSHERVIQKMLRCEKCDEVSGNKILCKACREEQSRQLKQVIEWPDPNELAERCVNESFLSVARDLGVSDNAVRKYLRRNGVEVPRKHKTRQG